MTYLWVIESEIGKHASHVHSNISENWFPPTIKLPSTHSNQVNITQTVFGEYHKITFNAY